MDSCRRFSQFLRNLDDPGLRVFDCMLKSTWIGLLNNVQCGISRPLGSQESQVIQVDS